MPNLKVFIDDEGNVHIDAIGFQGKACDKAIDEIEKILGTVVSRNRKKEYYNIEEQKETNKNVVRL